MSGSYVYIASDVHLGVPTQAKSRQREHLLVQWLETVSPDAEEIILLGDLFDFWFEYKHVVPKGYVRLLGKLAELTDAGLPITVFCGNHDMWYRDYFPAELGISVKTDEWTRDFFGQRYYLHHGDGKGPGDVGFKLMKKGMRNRFLRWLFRWLHPDWGVGLARHFSRRSRLATLDKDEKDHGPNEFLVQYVQRKVQAGAPFDHYVFGHRHMARQQLFQAGERQAWLHVLGDWLLDFSYLRVGPDGPEHLTFQNGHPEPNLHVIRPKQDTQAAAQASLPHEPGSHQHGPDAGAAEPDASRAVRPN